MYLSLVFLSCYWFLFSWIIRQAYLGSWGSSINYNKLFIFFFSIISLFAFYEVGINQALLCIYVKLGTWINSEILNVDWGFMFDSLTVTMCVVVTFVFLF